MKCQSSSSRKKLFLTGASGLLGTNLIYFLGARFDILGGYCDHPISARGMSAVRIDLSDRGGLKRLIDEYDPDVLVHAAALADVDACEVHPSRARKINVEGTANIVAALERSRAKLVFVSTDQVYDGDKGFSNEKEPLAPLNVYAQTKADAEKVVSRRLGSLILRTNLFGLDVIGKRSISGWCLSELGLGRRVKGFTDVIFSSLYTGDWADILVDLLDGDAVGVYNVGANGPLSKYAFLVKLAMLAGFNADQVVPSQLEDVPLRAPRGKNLSLSISKLENFLGRKVLTVEQSLERFVRDRSAGASHSIKELIVRPDLNQAFFEKKGVEP